MVDPPSRVDATSGTGHGGQSELFCCLFVSFNNFKKPTNNDNT